jgi:leader peptidase (prepilin peptidase)/N-methyltransferase
MAPFPAAATLVGAILFGLAGWLGGLLAETRYGAIPSDADGPATGSVPFWIAIAGCAVIGAAVGFRGAPPADAATLLLVVLALTVCTASDLRSGTIPDLFTLGPLVVLLAVATARHAWAPLLGALFAFVPFAATAALSRGRGMGWGDVKLAALGGAALGIGGITLAALAAGLGACVFALASRRLRRPVAFGPYLAVSIGAALALGLSL